ncbi:MAG: hypothetical protein KGL39_06780 [Patescibacteria group bacterium]|nr:hypothetical protein [Patescibacteria group bacterium]
MITISRRNWWSRIQDRFFQDDGPQNLCAYVWRGVAAILSFGLLAAIVATAVAAILLFLGAQTALYWLSVYLMWQPSLSAQVAGVAILLMSVCGDWLAVRWVVTQLNPGLRFPGDGTLTVAAAYISARKARVCPPITIVD